jgi:hypothetical protein
MTTVHVVEFLELNCYERRSGSKPAVLWHHMRFFVLFHDASLRTQWHTFSWGRGGCPVPWCACCCCCCCCCCCMLTALALDPHWAAGGGPWHRVRGAARRTATVALRLNQFLEFVGDISGWQTLKWSVTYYLSCPITSWKRAYRRS